MTADRRALERMGLSDGLAAEIVALPVADNLTDGSWALRCPWCSHGIARGPFLHDASLILARHAREAHRWQLVVFEISIGHLRRLDAEQEAAAA